MTTLEKILEIKNQIRLRMSGEVADNMRREGIIYKVNYGVSVPDIQQIAKAFKGDHDLAIELFREDIRECKIIATMIDNPEEVTGEQIDDWSSEFDNPEIVEQVCGNLIWKSEYALSRSIEWCLSNDELLQKAGFITIARKAPDTEIKETLLDPYLGIIENLADSITGISQNAIAFALRAIARRSPRLEQLSLQTAQQLTESTNEIAAWIGNEIIFEFGESSN
ncbi:MAG: DNA alkylation repair protein [Bacteroidales bacterium]|nr:DNA alkylation repair protein [Bacteroidales bacterium]